MKTIKGACPRCKKHFLIELLDGGQSFLGVVACDHCGYEKRVSVFIKELEQQCLAPIKREQARLRALAKAETQTVEAAKKKEVKATREAIKQHQAQLRQQQETQENQADLARLNVGGGCPRCGSIRSRIVRHTGFMCQAIGLSLMGIACVSLCCIPLLSFIAGPLGFGLILRGYLQQETKLRCLKCGFDRCYHWGA